MSTNFIGQTRKQKRNCEEQQRRRKSIKERFPKTVTFHTYEDIDEKISHNIFYTAITRTTDKLKIYMSKETQKKLAEKFVKSNVGLKQAQLFAGQAGLKLKNKLSS